MPSQIRPNRLEISDRFPMIGFTIKTDGENKRYEVAIAADAALFGPDGKAKRTRANFYSSRAAGLLPVERGEAVYVLPPEVLARFVGQEKLYYALATYTNGKPEITALPSAGNAYISLKGLSGRSLKRVRVLPSRQRVAAGYGNGAGELEWAGDAATPGTQPVSTAPAAAPAAPAPPPTDATAKAAALGVYDDGFGYLAPPKASPARSPRIPVRAQANESFSINWDDVELIPQPTTMGCWAAAGAMVFGWRDRVCIDPRMIADISGRTANLDNEAGLYPNEDCPFGRALGLLCEPPACYTIDGFRSLLERYGPLLVVIATPDFAHAVVVTGMYSDGAPDGSDTFIRVTDPLDRPVGSPGSPGNYSHPPTHTTGSRYIMRWADFMQEYENRETRAADGTSNIQILHAAGTDGRQPSRSGAAGYAMSAEDDDDAAHGIDGPIPDEPAAAAAQAYARPLTTSEYPQASRFEPAASGNFRAVSGTRTINRVVIHIADGGPNINGTISWFQNPAARVSSHYVVGQDGEVVQMVRNNDVAWHASSANGDSIGIEHVANTRGLAPTEAEYCASAALTRWLCDTYGIPIDRTHVLGHSEADPRTTHTACPNAVWDWDYFMGMVQSATCYSRSSQAQALEADDDDAAHGIEGPIPDAPAGVAAQAYIRALADPEYPQASRFEPANSGNYRAVSGTRTINRVVIHITDGGTRINGTIGWFQNPSARVSAHYVVGADGEVVQMVRNNDVAWHASSANGDSIGIEHVANGDRRVGPTRPPTEAEYCASAGLVRWLCDTYGIPIDRTHILGHSEADPRTTHTDCPNSVWDWDYFMGMVQSGTCYPRPAQSQGLSYAARPRAMDTSDDDAAHGIDGPIPDEPSAAAAQAYARPLTTSEYPQASRFEPAASGNFRAVSGTRTINRVVIHITDGGPNINGTISWFQNPTARVSSHYVVGQDGEVVQMVRNNDVAWHASSANGDSIGIEHVANTRGLMPTDAEYCASAALVRWLCTTYGIPIDRTHILGHSEADPRTAHTACPNAVWDWDYFMGLVQSESCYPRPAQSQSLGLPTPPRRIVRSQSLAVDGVTTVTGSAGNVSWDLDQFRGVKNPSQNGSAAPMRDAPAIALSQWPYVDTPTGGAIPASFSVAWQYNGKALGNVQIANTGATGVPSLRVTARIVDDAEADPNTAAMRIRFEYRFTAPDAVATTDLRLYGNGTYDQSCRWNPTNPQ